jgi:hypothetical protein
MFADAGGFTWKENVILSVAKNLALLNEYGHQELNSERLTPFGLCPCRNASGHGQIFYE